MHNVFKGNIKEMIDLANRSASVLGEEQESFKNKITELERLEKESLKISNERNATKGLSLSEITELNYPVTYKLLQESKKSLEVKQKKLNEKEKELGPEKFKEKQEELNEKIKSELRRKQKKELQKTEEKKKKKIKSIINNIKSKRMGLIDGTKNTIGISNTIQKEMNKQAEKEELEKESSSPKLSKRQKVKKFFSQGANKVKRIFKKKPKEENITKTFKLNTNDHKAKERNTMNQRIQDRKRRNENLQQEEKVQEQERPKKKNIFKRIKDTFKRKPKEERVQKASIEAKVQSRHKIRDAQVKTFDKKNIATNLNSKLVKQATEIGQGISTHVTNINERRSRSQSLGVDNKNIKNPTISRRKRASVML